MAELDKKGILSRWSRRKLEAAGEARSMAEQPAQEQNVGQMPPVENRTMSGGQPGDQRDSREAGIDLPSIDELGPESDFEGFMNPKIDDNLRRAALKKLFTDPHFNVCDGLDVYAEDYTNLETLTPTMVAGLKHARRLLFTDEQDRAQTESDQPVVPGSETQVISEAKEQSHAGTAHEKMIEDRRADVDTEGFTNDLIGNDSGRHRDMNAQEVEISEEQSDSDSNRT